MAGVRLVRFDFATLERLVALRANTEATYTNARDQTSAMWRAPSAGDIAAYLGIPPSTIHRYRRDGLTPRIADRLACHGLNLHPCLVWPDWWTKTEPRSMIPSREECTWS